MTLTRDEWRALAARTIAQFAASREPFTTDHLWSVLPATDEPRNLGDLMRAASHRKAIRATGRWLLSTRESCHSRPVREWIGV